jgi:hypothetical protein
LPQVHLLSLSALSRDVAQEEENGTSSPGAIAINHAEDRATVGNA